MRQQVNLYTAELRPQRDPLEFRRLLTALGVVAAVLIVVGLLLGWREHGLAVRHAQLQARVTDLQSRATDLSNELQGMHADPALQQAVTGLKQAVAERRKLLGRLHQVTGSSMQGFSPVLTALARQSIPGLWLTRVQVDGKTGGISLAGSTRDPETVPRYLARLRTESAFAGKAFGEFRMRQDPHARGQLDFELASSTGKLPAEAAR